MSAAAPASFTYSASTVKCKLGAVYSVPVPSAPPPTVYAKSEASSASAARCRLAAVRSSTTRSYSCSLHSSLPQVTMQQCMPGVGDRQPVPRQVQQAGQLGQRGGVALHTLLQRHHRLGERHGGGLHRQQAGLAQQRPVGPGLRRAVQWCSEHVQYLLNIQCQGSCGSAGVGGLSRYKTVQLQGILYRTDLKPRPAARRAGQPRPLTRPTARPHMLSCVGDWAGCLET